MLLTAILGFRWAPPFEIIWFNPIKSLAPFSLLCIFKISPHVSRIGNLSPPGHWNSRDGQCFGAQTNLGHLRHKNILTVDKARIFFLSSFQNNQVTIWKNRKITIITMVSTRIKKSDYKLVKNIFVKKFALSGGLSSSLYLDRFVTNLMSIIFVLVPYIS